MSQKEKHQGVSSKDDNYTKEYEMNLQNNDSKMTAPTKGDQASSATKNEHTEHKASKRSKKRNREQCLRDKDHIPNNATCNSCLENSECTRLLFSQCRNCFIQIEDIKADRDTWRRLYQLECRKIQIIERIKDKTTI